MSTKYCIDTIVITCYLEHFVTKWKLEYISTFFPLDFTTPCYVTEAISHKHYIHKYIST